MTSSRLGFVGYAVESAFAESATSYTVRLQARMDRIDVGGLTQAMLDPGGVYQYMNETSTHVRGPKGGSFELTMDLYGHGTTTAGSLSITDLVTLLGYAVGNGTATQVGGLLTTGTNDVNTLTSTNTTLAVGDLFRVGVPGDTRAEGQASVSNSSASPYDLLVDLPGAPTTADSVKAMMMVFPGETTHEIASTLRFIVCSGNQAWALKGCACTGIRFSFPQGQIARASMTWQVADWDDAGSITFPSATALGNKDGILVGGQGSLHVQAKGTTTRNVIATARDIEIEIDQQVTIIDGPGGVGSHQTGVAYRRTKQCATISWSEEAGSQSATPTWSNYWNTTEGSLTARQVCWTIAATDGRALAFYMPDAIPVGERPKQIDVNGLNYVRMMLRGRTNTVTTNEKTLSNWRLGIG